MLEHLPSKHKALGSRRFTAERIKSWFFSCASLFCFSPPAIEQLHSCPVGLPTTECIDFPPLLIVSLAFDLALCYVMIMYFRLVDVEKDSTFYLCVSSFLKSFSLTQLIEGKD